MVKGYRGQIKVCCVLVSIWTLIWGEFVLIYFGFQRFLLCVLFFVKYFSGLYMETGWERGGVTSSKGPQARTWTWGCCSEDKASVHGTPALPTELNSALLCVFSACCQSEPCLKHCSQFVTDSQNSVNIWMDISSQKINRKINILSHSKINKTSRRQFCSSCLGRMTFDTSSATWLLLCPYKLY